MVAGSGVDSGGEGCLEDVGILLVGEGILLAGEVEGVDDGLCKVIISILMVRIIIITNRAIHTPTLLIIIIAVIISITIHIPLSIPILNVITIIPIIPPPITTIIIITPNLPLNHHNQSL